MNIFRRKNKFEFFIRNLFSLKSRNERFLKKVFYLSKIEYYPLEKSNLEYESVREIKKLGTYTARIIKRHIHVQASRTARITVTTAVCASSVPRTGRKYRKPFWKWVKSLVTRQSTTTARSKSVSPSSKRTWTLG